MSDECSTASNPSRCRLKLTAVKVAFLLAVGMGFTAVLGTGLTLFAQ